ncbi:hypothetical protein PFISCL1PPCAC_11859 [Pristionchus fissidentatus]|uniref:Protein arginine N-methyltransferase n=1 Tax=Pristionchus fissidentatus TaxID=1538716 RepID=A0AAV5VRA8_9BILA|nr:hypothetical protein PFISCL1PPCAC_11859 [Pristionchus fissidentatus]
MSPKKKSNKKGKAAGGFDYESLIPSGLSGDHRELVKKFLTNQLASPEEREAALEVFAKAVVEERGDIMDGSSDTGDEEVINGLKAVVAGTASYEEGMGTSSAGGCNGHPHNGQTESSSAPPAAASAPSSTPSAATTTSSTASETKKAVAASGRKEGGKGGWKKVAVPVPHVREVVCREDWGADANAHLHKAPKTGPVKDSQPQHVKTEIANEVRKNVNVGWWASPYDADNQTDTRIAEYAQSLGGELYNFICYPIGGMERSRFRMSANTTPPPINLPDLQLANPHWETYVAGHPSLWIDCDIEEDPFAARLSVEELKKELAYAHYLGLSTVVIELWHKSAPNLAKVISHFLWTVQSNMKICILLPTQASMMDGDECDEREVWEIWADFRKSVGNFAAERLQCGIKLLENLDDEFVEAQALQRWQAEPISMFTMETNVFTTNDRTGGADLGPAHTALLEKLWTSEAMSAGVRGPLRDARGARMQYAQAIRSIIGPLWLNKKLSKKPNFLDLAEVNYQDVIQKPLQPLADNLQSGVYNTFEADTPKYKFYGEAIELALADMVKKRGKGDVVLYVLGAGRGPLMSASMAAEKRLNEKWSGTIRVRMECVCVEKNENAVVTLNYLNQTVWNGRVRIVQTDMRDLKKTATSLGLRRPDIIVSELLGSFGDNELSPECLDGCVDWLKEDTISIPQSYTSYCEPLASMTLYHSIRSQPTNVYQKGRQANGRVITQPEADGTWTQPYPVGRDHAHTDMLYVVWIDKAVRQMLPLPFFTFNHPCFDRSQTTREKWRNAQRWKVPETQDIMGFACYFSAKLYKGVTLSIVRGAEDETPDMLSWFPAVLPLRQPLRVQKGSELGFTVDRCIDEGGVWYEWFAQIWESDSVTAPPLQTTPVQNEGGVSYYMRLAAEEEEEKVTESVKKEDVEK